MKLDAADLRTFSDSVWAEPEVEAACLELQRDFGADVNLVLFALYVGVCGRAADAATRARAAAIAEEWTPAVIAPLRAARRALKARDADLHARAKALELDAEWALQARLQAVADAAPEAAASGDAIRASLTAVLDEEAVTSQAARRLLAAVPKRGARL